MEADGRITICTPPVPEDSPCSEATLPALHVPLRPDGSTGDFYWTADESSPSGTMTTSGDFDFEEPTLPGIPDASGDGRFECTRECYAVCAGKGPTIVSCERTTNSHPQPATWYRLTIHWCPTYCSNDTSDWTTGVIHNNPISGNPATDVEWWRAFRNGAYTGCEERTGSGDKAFGVQGTFSQDPCSGGLGFYGKGLWGVGMWYNITSG